MNKLLLLPILACLTFSAQAENLLYTDSVVKCGSYQLPPLKTVITTETPQIKFEVEIINKENGKNRVINHTIFNAYDNNYESFSNLKTTTYIKSVNTVPNPTLDPVALAKTPYIITQVPGEITTGLSFVVLPKIENNNIVAQICVSDSDLVAIRNAKDNDLQFPEFNSKNSLMNVVLASGKTTVFPINNSLDLKITAKKI